MFNLSLPHTTGIEAMTICTCPYFCCIAALVHSILRESQRKAMVSLHDKTIPACALLV